MKRDCVYFGLKLTHYRRKRRIVAVCWLDPLLINCRGYAEEKVISVSPDPDSNPGKAELCAERADTADKVATQLGTDLSEIAERYRASGAKLLTQDEILCEVNERRG